MNVLSETRPALNVDRIVADKERARITSYFLLIAVDTLALSVGLILANQIYLGEWNSEHGLVLLGILLPLHLAASAFGKAYSGAVLEDPRRGVGLAVRSFLLAAAAALMFLYLAKASQDLSRGIFAIGLVSALCLVVIGRLAVHRTIARILDGSAYSTVIICDGMTFEGSPTDIICTPEQLGFDPTTSDPISYHRFAAAVADADRMIVLCTEERRAAWASVMKSMAVEGELVTGAMDELGIIGFSTHGGLRTMIVTRGPLTLSERAQKRALDLAIAAAGVTLLFPLLIVVAIWIKMDSRGPVLFRQERIGRDNRFFQVYKFRSMYSHMSDLTASQLTLRGDSRVTRVGAIIRRTSIDELPQLFNVLKGDMSIVGPRPHAISARAADLLYWDVDPRYRHRHSIKPGLTGLAQIRGYRGNTERHEDLTNRLAADLEYCNGWSVWRDLMIILQTVRVLRHDNAF